MIISKENRKVGVTFAFTRKKIGRVIISKENRKFNSNEGLNMRCVTLLRGKELAEKLGRPEIALLLYLYQSGKAYIRQISRDLEMSNTTVYNALITLIDLRLVEEVGGRGRRYIQLTDRGREVAELLLKIDEKLEESKTFSRG